MSRKIQIAVDGYSSCGKSTLAREVAASLGYVYIDTGAMYRAVALAMLREGMDAPASYSREEVLEFLGRHSIAYRLPEDGPAGGQPELTLDGEPVGLAIREGRVANIVSEVAAIPVVREALVAQQRRLGQGGGVVMDGRDIGTVVFPQAELKIFMTASPEVRAQRRFAELQEKGIPSTYAEVLANLKLRDTMDSSRANSPLRQAPDAVLLDNSRMGREEQLARVLELARGIINRPQ
ncbi:MAG: cytidylate kinase [Bacteroidia bacterium]|nr:MAG: cytidylate kinase [Bacteroidia bacterium]